MTHKNSIRWIGILIRVACAVLLILLCGFLTGCSLENGEEEKVRDLDYVILSEELYPAELKKLVEEQKKTPFQFTYTDHDKLYLCVGYGEQKTGGYSIAVDELYLTDSAVCVRTTLLGPKPKERVKDAPSYPMLIIETEYIDKPATFR